MTTDGDGVALSSGGHAPSDRAERPAPAPAAARSSSKRRAHNLAIAAILVTITIDCLPNSIPGIGRLNSALNPLLNLLGLYQAQWTLFAPAPDNTNSWLEAKILYSNGTLAAWTTPEWEDRTLFEKWTQGRHPKFADSLRNDGNKKAWPHLAGYVLRTHPPPAGAQAEQIMLIRHWWEMPKPDEEAAERVKFEHYPPRRDEFPDKYVFYNEKLR